MTKIVEKPSTPISKLANIGLYYIKDVKALWAGIDHVLASPANKGEYFLTDAFQHMIEHGRRILTAEVGGWYDCGKLDTLLETNEVLLRKGAARKPDLPGVTFIDPVLVQEGALIERSTIGPNVTVEAGTRISDSSVRNSVIGRKAIIDRARLADSMIGDRVVVENFQGSTTLGDDSEIRGGQA